jgi:hypothetical protein
MCAARSPLSLRACALRSEGDEPRGVLFVVGG